MRTRTRNLKRLLSLALCLCMVTGLLPMAALAAEDTPVITTESLAEATVGEAYNATLTATASDAKGTLDWEAAGLPNGLALTGSGETAALLGTPTEAGTFIVTVTVTETIPAAEPEDPAEGTEPTEGTEPVQGTEPDQGTEPIEGTELTEGGDPGQEPAPAEPTVLTVSKEYTLTVAEAAPTNDPGTEPGISLRSVTSKRELSGFNLYLQPESGGTVGPEDIITQFSIANELFLTVDNYPGTNPTKIALISNTLNVANLNETDLSNNALFLAVGGQNGAMNAVSGRLVADHFRTVDSAGSVPVAANGISTLNDGGEYRFLVWDGADSENQTVYYSSNTYTYTAANTIDMTVTRDGQSVTSFANTDTITITATLPTAPSSIGSIFFGEQYMYLAPDSVQTSGNTVTITMNGLYTSTYGEKRDPLALGSYKISFWDDIEKPDGSYDSIEYVSAATYTVTGEGGTPAVSTPTIDTTSLSGGVTGTAYSQTLQATPGTDGKAVTWSVTSGSLPVGLTLGTDGSITGTPTTAGSYTFTVTAAEQDGGETSKSFTITITEAITSRELKVGSGSYGPGDNISVIWNMSAGVPEDGEATLTLYYTDTSNMEKNAQYKMTRSPLGYFYAYVGLPDDCASVQKVSAEAKVSGQTVTGENTQPGITMKGKLSLNWTGDLERMVTLEIKDEQSGNTVTHYLYRGSTGMELSLPAGEYTLSATISVIGMGDVPVLKSPAQITITNGATTTQELTFSSMEVVTYRPEVVRADGDTLYSSGYSLYWYEDAARTKPLGVGYSYTAMADKELYVKAVPMGTLSATHNESTLTLVTLADKTPALTLPAKTADTVTVTVQCADVASGTGTLNAVSGTVVLSQPGDDGTKTTQVWVYSRDANQVTFEGVTEGSTITFTPNDQYLCGPVSETIGNVTGGSQSITLTAQPLRGVITLNFTLNREIGSSNPGLSGFYELAVKKSDGTAIPFHRVGSSWLVLDDLTGLSAGTQLTISGQYGSGDFPIADFTTNVTLGGENLSATQEVTMDARGRVTISTEIREVAVADLLLYRNNELYYTKENYVRSAVLSGGWSRTSWTVSLPAGSYTVYVVDRDYLSAVDPDTYQTASDIPFQGGTYDSASFTIEDKTTQYVNLNAPGIVQSHADVNYEMSSVTGTEDFPGTLTHTTVIALTSNEKLDESKGISLKLFHKQFYGALPVRSIAINGNPLSITMGTASNGRLDLGLSDEDLERYGGFPLRISFVIERHDYSKLDFESYMSYTNDAGESRTARVGTFYQEGGDVTLNVPSLVGEKEFFVSGYIPEWRQDVTIYLDGAAVATVQSGPILDSDGSVARYSVTGYFAAKVTLPDDVEEFDTFRITAAWAEGASKEQEVMYTETAGAIKKVTLDYNGDYFPDYVLWERGNSVSENRYVTARSSSTLSWMVEFFNPDKVENVVIHVPRSDGSELQLDAAKGNDGVFRTETRTFYGAIPTGVYVTYDNELIPRANAKEPISAQDFQEGIDALNKSGVISDMVMTQGTMADNQYALTFTLQNPNGTGTIDVSVESTTEAWDDTTEAELASFDALKQKPEYSSLPSYILYYDEGYLDIYENDDREGGFWGSDRICKYETVEEGGSGTIYQREIYTMSERIVITWDVNNKTTTTHRITLGDGGAQPDETLATGGTDAAKAYQRTAQVEQLWMLFYQQISDACEKAGTANTLSARTMSLAASKGSKLSLKGKIDVNKFKERAEALAEDSETWAEGQEITAAEIRQIKDFLDDNPGLVDLYKMYQSQGGDNPYKVVGDIRATYYERGMGLIEKALSLATGKPKDVVDALKDGVKDYALDTVKGKIFYRQSQAMVCDLYTASCLAQRRENGVGGMLPNGINWSRFPTNIYDPSSILDCGAKTSSNRLPVPNSPRGTYDPSGYVYEAVPSNRVQGATVNLYTFNESVKAQEWVEIDRYGISEENPQTTGADGRYEWFVPEGYWRVVVTKEGYATVDTGSSADYGQNATDQLEIGDTTVDTNGQYWMPVLPIQLDVNIPLVSYEAPEVDKVEATTEGVYITFSKYMQDDLDVDDFKINGTAPDSVEALNAEASSSAADAPKYASIFLLTYPTDENVGVNDTIQVYVNSTVASYAGTQMEEPYAGENVTVAEQLPQTDAPTLASGSTGGTVDKNTVVYLEVPDGTAVYYTTDDTDPSSSSTRKLYSADSGIIVDQSMTIKAVAVQAGKADSTVLTLNYNVAQETPEIPDKPDEPVIPDDPGGSSGGGGGGSSGYSISVPSSSSIKGGSVTVSPRSADKGDAVTITVKPDEGYELDTLTVTDSKGSELELTDKGSGKYTFAMPGSSVKIQVSFKEIAEQVTNPFTDVYESDYYYDAVLWAVANGVTAGTSATTFSPNAPVTRAQMVTFLWRAYGSPKATGSNPFADVSADAWYYDAVLWAVANGVTVGTSATTFSPDAPVTRSQAVTFQWRAAGSPVVAGDSFDDVAADAYYAGAVTWAVANGITNGTGGNKFSPEVTVTRAQAVTFLWRELA